MQRALDLRADVRKGGGRPGKNAGRHAKQLVNLPCIVVIAHADKEETKHSHDNKFYSAVAAVELLTVSTVFHQVDDCDANMWRDCPKKKATTWDGP
jgi:hypothetical protein